MRKDTILILTFLFIFSYCIIVYYDDNEEEKFGSELELPTGYYTNQLLCQSSPSGPVCSTGVPNGYCSDTTKVCFGGTCVLPVCGGGSSGSTGYLENQTGYCSGNYSCNKGKCEISDYCGLPQLPRTGICIFDSTQTCKEGTCDPNNKYCGLGGTGCSLSPDYICNLASGRCLGYVKTSNFSFGGYNSITPNPQPGLSDSENKFFTNVDIGTYTNGTVEQCKTACNENIECGAFTRSATIADNVSGDCYLKKRFNDAKGNMISNRYGYPSYAYNSWIKAGEREKLNIKRSTDGKIFSLK